MAAMPKRSSLLYTDAGSSGMCFWLSSPLGVDNPKLSNPITWKTIVEGVKGIKLMFYASVKKQSNFETNLFIRISKF